LPSARRSIHRCRHPPISSASDDQYRPAAAEEKLEAKMILQVHDELLFEAPTKERGKLEKLVQEEMGRRPQTAVPIVVEIGAGPNWRDLD